MKEKYQVVSGKVVLEGKKYFPGAVIELNPETAKMLPVAKVKIDIDDNKTEDTRSEPKSEVKEGLVVKHKGAGRYDVINEATGEPLNDEYLTKDQAEALAGGDAAQSADPAVAKINLDSDDAEDDEDNEDEE